MRRSPGGRKVGSVRCKVRYRAVAALVVGALLAAGHAQAQAPGGAPAAAAAACVPQCRTGFVCSKGQCVSLCNPPCEASEACTASGECVPLAPAASTVPTAAPAAPPQPALPGAAPPLPAPPPQQAPQAPATIAPAAPPAASGAHFHDGFYFRGGLGVAFETSSSDHTTSGGNHTGFNTSGWGVGMELAFGGTPAPGVVVGGVILGASVFGAHLDSVSVNGSSASSADKRSYSGTTSMVGPFVDWYFRPNDGLHAQAALCFTTLAINRENDTNTFLSGNGFGFVVGGGYEWWVADQWSLGVLGRLQVALPTVHDSSNNQYGTTMFVPAILMSATYH
jgi:hypothetical protein